MHISFRVIIVATALLFAAPIASAQQMVSPVPTIEFRTKWTFDELVTRLEAAIAKNRMGLVASASASRGAAARGVRIPGNAVLMVFRNDFAVRMLDASVSAGIEAPLRFYVTESPDNTASLHYRAPSAVFAPYRNAKLDALAVELDPIFAAIARDATGR